MSASPTSLEELIARAMMNVRARQPGCADEWPVLSSDPDFDDLPANGDEGCSDDEITQEAVLRLARTAIDTMTAHAVSTVMKNSHGTADPALVENVIRALRGEHVSFLGQPHGLRKE